MTRMLFLVAAILISRAAFGALYKCQTEGGKTTYQDAPCGKVSHAVQSTLPSSSTQTVINTQQTTYTGPAISINFPNAPLFTALQVIADFSGNKLSMPPSITGFGTFHYVNRPWDEVLNDIAVRYKLSITIDGGTIIVRQR